jgi:arylsulfatase A-like enzyme
MTRILLIVLVSLFGLAGLARAGERPRPNILLILADDLGWSDLGCYGGEIRTPNLDALAKNGLRFTRFYNSARCSPSRASLLTGLHPHQAGFPNLGGEFRTDCVTIPEVLDPAGYRSSMVGKWHLGRATPVDRGFDDFYGMLGGFNSCWQEQPYFSRLPQGRPRRQYAPGTFYATDAFGDYALDFIQDGQKSGKPWFLYLAFNAPHFPLHAWEEDIARYERVYAQGWDRIREQRLARQKKLGLMPRDLALTPRSLVPANRFNLQTGWADRQNPAWDSLPADRRADLARRMAVYAAMVDRMDQAIGRVARHLKKTGQWKNTLILFLSDNGACAEWDPWGFDGNSGPNNVLHTGAALKKVGGPDSYISYGSGWANASNTPWRLYKHYGHEGGINTPLIVHWPAGLKTAPGATLDTPGHVADVLPTLIEITGASYPKERDRQPVLPLEGISLLPLFQGRTLPARPIFMEHEGNRAVREGDWKLVALAGKPWELYQVAGDPTETRDLAAREPERVRRMAAAWDAWAKRCSVPEPPPRPGATGGGAVPTPQIAGKGLTITCEVEPQSRDGVILAQGGDQHGYALHLREGKLVFTVRVAGQPVSIVAAETPPATRGAGTRLSIEARLGRDGVMLLAINGRQAASGKAPGTIPVQPVDELSIGEDSRTAVGEYIPPHPLRGTIRNVRITTDPA